MVLCCVPWLDSNRRAVLLRTQRNRSCEANNVESGEELLEIKRTKARAREGGVKYARRRNKRVM